MLPILVVEPHLELRTAIASVLGRAKLSCDTAATAADALLKLRDGSYSHIVVDVDPVGPDMTPLYERLAKDPALMSTVVVISDGDEPPASMTNQPVLLKPFDTRQLLRPLEE